MKCKRCSKLIKEDTEGNQKYCQGHDVIDTINAHAQLTHAQAVADHYDEKEKAENDKTMF